MSQLSPIGSSYIYIQGSVSEKCPRFCKYLRFSKSGLTRFSDFSGRQKGPALTARNRWSVVVMETRIESILLSVYIGNLMVR